MSLQTFAYIDVSYYVCASHNIGQVQSRDKYIYIDIMYTKAEVDKNTMNFVYWESSQLPINRTRSSPDRLGAVIIDRLIQIFPESFISPGVSAFYRIIWNANFPGSRPRPRSLAKPNIMQPRAVHHVRPWRGGGGGARARVLLLRAYCSIINHTLRLFLVILP